MWVLPLHGNEKKRGETQLSIISEGRKTGAVEIHSHEGESHNKEPFVGLHWTHRQDLRLGVWVSATLTAFKKIHSSYKETVELLLIPTPRKGGAEGRARIAQDGGRSPVPPLTGRIRQTTDGEN